MCPLIIAKREDKKQEKGKEKKQYIEFPYMC